MADFKDLSVVLSSIFINWHDDYSKAGFTIEPYFTQAELSRNLYQVASAPVWKISAFGYSEIGRHSSVFQTASA
jgi:hypothetical protein